MLKALQALFGGGSTPPNLVVVPGTPFEWPRGLKLLAIEDTHFVFPGQLWCDGESIGSVLDVSNDDAELGFEKSASGQIDAIHVVLKANQSLALHRSSEAVVVANDKRQRMFPVLAGKPAA